MTPRRDFLAIVAGAVGAGTVLPVGTAMAAEHPDAELLRLGAPFDTRRSAEREAWDAVPGHQEDDGPDSMRAYALSDLVYEVVHQIKIIPATTLEGMMVKRRVVDWIYDGNPVTAEMLQPYPDLGIEVIAAVLADLNTTGGAVA
jgi:hypothetical protein